MCSINVCMYVYATKISTTKSHLPRFAKSGQCEPFRQKLWRLQCELIFSPAISSPGSLHLSAFLAYILPPLSSSSWDFLANSLRVDPHDFPPISSQSTLVPSKCAQRRQSWKTSAHARSLALVRVDFLFVRRFVCLVCAKKWTLELNGFIVILSFMYRNNKRSIAHGILTWRIYLRWSAKLE